MSKKVCFKFSQSSQKNTCAGVTFLIKLQTGNLKLYFKRDFHTGLSCECFQFCKNTYCEEICKRLVLRHHCQSLSLVKLQTWRLKTYNIDRERLQRRCFSVNFEKLSRDFFCRTPPSNHF